MVSIYVIFDHCWLSTFPLMGKFAPKRSDPGGRLLVPLGIRLQKDAQMLMLIVERKASGNYRTLVPEDGCHDGGWWMFFW